MAVLPARLCSTVREERSSGHCSAAGGVPLALLDPARPVLHAGHAGLHLLLHGSDCHRLLQEAGGIGTCTLQLCTRAMILCTIQWRAKLTADTHPPYLWRYAHNNYMYIYAFDSTIHKTHVVQYVWPAPHNPILAFCIHAFSAGCTVLHCIPSRSVPSISVLSLSPPSLQSRPTTPPWCPGRLTCSASGSTSTSCLSLPT